MRKAVTSLTFVVALTGALVAVGPISPAQAKPVPTPFGFSGYGAGAVVVGGELPVDSGPVGSAVIACTNEAGQTHQNATATVEIPGLGTLEGVETRVWTRKRGDTVSSTSRHRIANVLLAETDLGRLSIAGLEARSRVWHDATGYHAETSTRIAGIKLRLPGEAQQDLPLPTPGQPIVIPGVVRISLGSGIEREGENHAQAIATALSVHLIPSDTTVRIARARGHIGAAPQGVYDGIAYGLRGTALDGVVRIGRTQQLIMPCRGTNGEIRQRAVADVDIPGLGTVGAINTSQRSKKLENGAEAWQMAETAAVSLGGGAIQVEGIKARAFVKRVDGEGIVTRSTKGTKVLQLTVNGEPIALPDTGVVEIPGVVKIETGISEPLPQGLKVTALRLTLLEGTGAVVDLGVARQTIGRFPQ